MPVLFGADGKQVGGGKRRQRNNNHQQQNVPVPFSSSSAAVATIQPPSNSANRANATTVSTTHAAISDAELSATIATLSKLAASGEDAIFGEKRFKPLRQALHPLLNSLSATTKDASAFVARVSAAVSDRAWGAAIATLKRMTLLNLRPKLGSVQRWVRDIDVASSISISSSSASAGHNAAEATHAKEEEEEEYDDQEERFLMLDAVLRCAAPEQIALTATPPALLQAAAASGRPLVMLPDVTFGRNSSQMLPALEDAALEPWKGAASPLKVLKIEKAAERTPPNLFDMCIWRQEEEEEERKKSNSNDHSDVSRDVFRPSPCCLLDPSPATVSRVRRVDIPGVPGSCCLLDVLSTEEAHAIIQMCTPHFIPDVPINNKQSVLAHHVCWLPNTQFMDTLVARCLPHFPSHLAGASLCREHSINRRFRTYRYNIGNVYRSHVDGAWPPSTIAISNINKTKKSSHKGQDDVCEENGGQQQHSYVYDLSDGKILSRLTFLLYLNDGFEGGHTRFFLPAKEEGMLRCVGVTPRCGSVILFPHGDLGLLVHEGSGVTAGQKVIIRTEVEFWQTASK